MEGQRETHFRYGTPNFQFFIVKTAEKMFCDIFKDELSAFCEFLQEVVNGAIPAG